LFGKALVLGPGGVKVAFCSLGTDVQPVASLLQCGDAGVGGGRELGFAWADGAGMNWLPTSTTREPCLSPSILEPGVPAGGIEFS
jgi:hypothetical protein